MTESVFTYGAPALKLGAGAALEIGYDLSRLRVRRVLLVTDKGVAAAGSPARVAEAMSDFDIESTVFDGVHVEPTDVSIREAVDFARSQGPWDALVAVGGGSAIDTAKAVNLLLTNPGTLLDYVNVPFGAGRSPSAPLLPLVAVPTTTGTGSESTTICVLDLLDQKVKSGISHPALRPTFAVVDPELTLSQPAAVTAASGMDVLCHALESWTARPYDSYPRKAPEERVPYCGANPISDVWAERALSLLAGALRRSVREGSDLAARSDMALAATMAGLGFGNAGVHIPHACAYPIAGRVHGFRMTGYPDAAPLVPHGIAVSLTAPAAFRFTYAADPARHLRAAELLAGGTAGLPDDPAERLPAALVGLMRDIGIPNGLRSVGYDDSDVAELVPGAIAQKRLLSTAPLDVSADDLAHILRTSLENW